MRGIEPKFVVVFHAVCNDLPRLIFELQDLSIVAYGP